MEDDDLGNAAAIWLKGRTTKAAIVELWVMLIKTAAAVGAITERLGVVIQEPSPVTGSAPDGQGPAGGQPGGG